MSPRQPSLFDGDPDPAWPEGFAYRAAIVSESEEAALAEAIAPLPFRPYRFRGYDANRRVVSFGYRYDEEAGGLAHAGPIPDFLIALRDRAAAFAGLHPPQIAHVLINEYQPGAGIGWHRDRPQFGDVVGVSLLAPCILRLRRRVRDGFERRNVPLEVRSVYLLRGAARHGWEHSIAPMRTMRYSVTFRTLAAP